LIYVDWLDDGTLADYLVNQLVESVTGNSTKNITAPVIRSGNDARAVVIYEIEGSTTPRDDMVRRRYMEDDGTTGTVEVLSRHCGLGSRGAVWTDTDDTTKRVFVMLLHDSAVQPMYALVEATYAVGVTAGTSTFGDEIGLIARVLPSTAQDSTYTLSHLPQLENVGSDKFSTALVERLRLDSVNRDVYSENGLVDTTFTLADPRAYRGVQEGSSLYMPGGYVAQYNGERMVEAGHLLFPEDCAGTPANGAGGMTSSATYGYIFRWERRSPNGERQLSGGIGVTITMGAAANEVAWVIPTNPWTNDDNLVLAGYRTEANPGNDAAYYRITSVDPSVGSYKRNLVNSDTVTFTDGLADSAITTLELDYRNPGSDGTELENISPPPTPIIAAGQSRLWVVDPQDSTLVRFSKLRIFGDGVNFNDSISIQAPQPGGDITALEVTEGGVLIFKTSAIYIVQGVGGPDNLGNNPYPPASVISRGIGCADARSLVRIPPGVMFRSLKGFYLLDNAYQLQQLVAGPEDYDSTDIAGAIDVPTQHQARFLLTATGELVYDYLLNEWSVWPNLFGTSISTRTTPLATA
jgi:hypothetical protein